MSGDFIASVGDDRNLMLWSINEASSMNKGVVIGFHKRAIYSVTWSKGYVTDSDGV